MREEEDSSQPIMGFRDNNNTKNQTISNRYSCRIHFQTIKARIRELEKYQRLL